MKPVLPKDSQLLVQVRQGNKEAFNFLYERYWEQTYSNAYKRLKDADQSKDIVQEIFVNIWVNRERVIENLPAYLNVAVRNQVFKLARKDKNRTHFLDTIQEIPDPGQDADANICSKEFFKAYELILAKLPPKRQLIFRLRFHDDQPTKCIADHMEISRKTVQNQLGKAIEQLRIVLLPCIILLTAMI